MLKIFNFEKKYLDIQLIYNSRSFSNKQINKIIIYLNECIDVIEKDLFLKNNYNFATAFDKKSRIQSDIVLCSNWKIKKLNKEFRKKNSFTDVLSFPVYECFKSEKKLYSVSPVLSLGDIYISKDKALQQANQFSISVENEILHLFVHGFLHLLGFDHELSKKDEKEMFDIEQKIIKKVQKKIK